MKRIVRKTERTRPDAPRVEPNARQAEADEVVRAFPEHCRLRVHPFF